MKKSTLMLIIGAAVAFFGYRYLSKKNAAPAADSAAPVDGLSSSGAYTDTGGASSDISQVQPVTQVSQAQQKAAIVNPVAPASDGVKGPVIPALVGYKGQMRPVVVNYTGTGIDPNIYTLKSGATVGGYLNNNGSYTITTIVKNPYYVPGTVTVPVSDLNIPTQV
jgi:hypothetical protein